MGKRCMPCNLSPEEQKAAWEEFGERLTRGEEEEIMEEVLPNYLFYQVEGRNRRRCVCTHLECGVFEIERAENREFYGLKHGDITKCPVCGGRVMLKAVGRLRTFRSLNDRKWKQITVCRTGKDGALLLMKDLTAREMNGPQYKFRWFLDAWKDWVEAGSKRDKQGNPILTKSNKEKTA